MHCDSRPLDPNPLSSDSSAPNPAYRKHKRTTSLASDYFDRNQAVRPHSTSFDLAFAKPSDAAQSSLLFDGALDERLFQQNSQQDKVQIIEALEPDLSGQAPSSGSSFYPLLNRLSLTAWDASHYLSTAKFFAGSQADKDKALRLLDAKNKLYSIPEQSELASSVFNSIHRHSNSEIQKMLSTHGFRTEDGECDLSSHRSKVVSPRPPANPVNSMAQLKVDPEVRRECLEQFAAPVPQVPSDAFKKCEPVPEATRPFLSSDNFDSRKLPRGDPPRNPAPRVVKLTRKFDSSSKKDTILKEEPPDLRRLKGSERTKPIARLPFSRPEFIRPNLSHDRPERAGGPVPSHFKLTLADPKSKVRGFLSDLRHELTANIPASPQGELMGALKEGSGIFTTLLKRDARRARAEPMVQLIKTVKSDERPDVIQKLYKFRAENGRLIAKKEAKREFGWGFKQKIRTLNFIPAEPEKKGRGVLVRQPGLSHRQSIRQTTTLDQHFKQSFMNRGDKTRAGFLDRPTLDRPTNSSHEHQCFRRGAMAVPDLQHQQTPLPKSGAKPRGPYRVKTESEASCKRNCFNADKRLLQKFMRPQNTDTKTKNLNIYLPYHEPFSEDSLAESQHPARPHRPHREAEPQFVWRQPKLAATLLPKRPVSGLFGKTRSLSSACLSKIGRSNPHNGPGANSIQVRGDPTDILVRETPKIGFKRLRGLGSHDRRTEVAEKGRIASPKFKSRQERQLRLMSGDFSELRRRIRDGEESAGFK